MVALVVGLHVVVECFFVAEELIVLEVVVDLGFDHLLQQLCRLVLRLLASGLAVPLVAQRRLGAFFLQEVGFLLELCPAEVVETLGFLLTEGPPPSLLQELLDQVAVVAPPYVENQRVSAVSLDLAKGHAVEGGCFFEELMVLCQFSLKVIVGLGAY